MLYIIFQTNDIDEVINSSEFLGFNIVQTKNA